MRGPRHMNDTATQEFDISQYTRAKLRLSTTIEYEGIEPEAVFETMGDPERITDWYLLAKTVKIHPPGPDGETNFNVEFVFFGDVYEEILLWDVPHRYVYLAKGDDFPIKDYVAMIEVEPTGRSKGVMRWTAYFDEIEGEHNKRILPIIFPPINNKSAELLAGLIGGVRHSVECFFEDFGQ
jgi:hypothetical protein